MKRSHTTLCIIPAMLVVAACGKSNNSGPSVAAAASEVAPAKKVSASPAAPAAAAPATGAPASPVPAAATPPPASTPPSPEAARRTNAIEWALKLDEIKSDPNGQWATQAKASSTFNDAQGSAAYSANQAAGAPNVEGYGSSISAWTPKTADAGIEWLDLQFPKPVHATKVRVRESNGTGAVIKVELLDEQGAAHVVWTGTDATKGLDFLIVEFPRTEFKTARVKITLATNVVPGWNSIDAVQLVGTVP